MAAWPSDVPLTAAVNSISEDVEDTRAKFTPDVGRPLLRRRQTAVDTIVSYDSTAWTDAQWASFWDFYIDNQALVFTRTHPDLNISGTKSFQFEAAPKRKRIMADRNIVSISLRYLG